MTRWVRATGRSSPVGGNRSEDRPTERAGRVRGERGRGERGRGERGSVLVLVPAGLLVLLLLGAITVDSAVAYLGQEQLRNALIAAANDAATAALDNSTFYRAGAVTLDLATTESVVCQDVVAADASQLHDVELSVGIQGDTVHVAGSATIDEVFGRMVPGFGRRTVRADATAVAVEGGITAAPADPRPATMVPVDCGGGPP